MTIAQNTVTVDGTFGLRDWSGNWDDAYDGNIDFVVVAELQPVTAPPPRADLTITGMEANQATQFFRSSSFLDPANVRPDNSIFLIARKDTGIRVYSGLGSRPRAAAHPAAYWPAHARQHDDHGDDGPDQPGRRDRSHPRREYQPGSCQRHAELLHTSGAVSGDGDS